MNTLESNDRRAQRSNPRQEDRTCSEPIVLEKDPRQKDRLLSPASYVAIRDVERSLGRFFSNGRAAPRTDIPGLPIASLRTERVDDTPPPEIIAWEFTGDHTVASLYAVPPTGRSVRVRGMTLVIPTPEFPMSMAALTNANAVNAQLVRSMDWLGILAQLGVVPASRSFGGELSSSVPADFR